MFNGASCDPCMNPQTVPAAPVRDEPSASCPSSGDYSACSTEHLASALLPRFRSQVASGDSPHDTKSHSPDKSEQVIVLNCGQMSAPSGYTLCQGPMQDVRNPQSSPIDGLFHQSAHTSSAPPKSSAFMNSACSTRPTTLASQECSLDPLTNLLERVSIFVPVSSGSQQCHGLTPNMIN